MRYHATIFTAWWLYPGWLLGTSKAGGRASAMSEAAEHISGHSASTAGFVCGAVVNDRVKLSTVGVSRL